VTSTFAAQKGFDLIRVDRVVIDEQNAFALMPQLLHHGGERGLLLILRANPAEPYAERHQIGAHGGVRLRPDPPSRPVIAAMFLGVGRRKRCLVNAAQPMHRRDGNAALGAGERCFDLYERVVAAKKMRRHADGDV
jgi:hypothetical protein